MTGAVPAHHRDGKPPVLGRLSRRASSSCRRCDDADICASPISAGLRAVHRYERHRGSETDPVGEVYSFLRLRPAYHDACATWAARRPREAERRPDVDRSLSSHRAARRRVVPRDAASAHHDARDPPVHPPRRKAALMRLVLIRPTIGPTARWRMRSAACRRDSRPSSAGIASGSPTT